MPTMPETRQTVTVDISSGWFFERIDLRGTDLGHGIVQSALSLQPESPVARETHTPGVIEVWPRLGMEAIRGMFDSLETDVTFTEQAAIQLEADRLARAA